MTKSEALQLMGRIDEELKSYDSYLSDVIICGEDEEPRWEVLLPIKGGAALVIDSPERWANPKVKAYATKRKRNLSLRDKTVRHLE